MKIHFHANAKKKTQINRLRNEVFAILVIVFKLTL